MTIVLEHLDAFPFTGPVRRVERQEALLFAAPRSPAARRMQQHAPLACVHFAPAYQDRPFGPPTGVYESAFLRVEWQAMNGRQPFYHRNTGADEISFQVAGERTLMTELGCVDLVPGDLARLPNGVAHDNRGCHDIHLLFYVSEAMTEAMPATRQSEPKREPFPGWQPQQLDELVTAGVGGPGTDIVMAPVDERLLLDHANASQERIKVLHPDPAALGTTWLYASGHVLIGRCHLRSSTGTDYRRHLDATEIQYQVEGHRTLVTQRGLLELGPGDFVSIPAGVAFASLHASASTHLVLATPWSAPQVAQTTREASPASAEHLERLRASIRAQALQHVPDGAGPCPTVAGD